MNRLKKEAAARLKQFQKRIAEQIKYNEDLSRMRQFIINDYQPRGRYPINKRAHDAWEAKVNSMTPLEVAKEFERRDGYKVLRNWDKLMPRIPRT